MKLVTLTVIFLFISLNCFSQNTTFESVFQILKNKEINKTEIYHSKLSITVQKNRVEIYSINGDSKISLFQFPVNFETVDNNTYAYTDEYDSIALFVCNEQKLTIINEKMNWTIYGIIPMIVKLD